MSNFTITLEIKAPEIVQVVQALGHMFTSALNQSTPVVQASKPAVQGTVVKKEEIKEEIKEEPKQEEAKVESKAEESSITVEEIRVKVKEKAKINKTAVKNLLKEYGATSVTTLEKQHYDAFFEKLGDL